MKHPFSSPIRNPDSAPSEQTLIESKKKDFALAMQSINVTKKVINQINVN